MRDPYGHEWMTTYTGRRVYPLDMRDEDIVIEDIAHALAHQCRFAGHVREQTVGGASFLRLDVPGPTEGSEVIATQFYSPAAVYCITPTTEAIARRLAQASRPEPVQRWELPPAPKDRNRCGASVDYEIEVEDDPDDGGRD